MHAWMDWWINRWISVKTKFFEDMSVSFHFFVFILGEFHKTGFTKYFLNCYRLCPDFVLRSYTYLVVFV